MISTKSNFKTASEAFDYFYIKMKDKGVDFDNTKALFNVGFYIHNPSDKQIKAGYRKWNQKYAEAEWAWYLSCLLYTSPSPRDRTRSRMPSSA